MTLLPILLAVPFLGSLACMLLSGRGLPDKTPWVVTMITTALGLGLLTKLTFFPGAEAPIAYFAEWVPAMGLNFSLWLDGPALFFAWLVLALGFLIFLYAGFYMDPKDAPWRFFGTMCFFMGAMLGVVISKNALLMFLFWELTSVSSFILIGHWHEKPSARAGALRALIVTGGGGLCLMAGLAGLALILINAGIPATQAMEWDVLWENSKIIVNHPMVPWFLVLVLIGAFTKSAQFPFHFWLPGAMEAPTPVSAFLHAATMVKAGIYLLGRLYPIFWEMELWLIILGVCGTATMLIGGFMAMMSVDLKQLLAHSTVSQLGLLTAYYGFGHGMVGSDHMLPLDLLLIASHALFKGGLFMLIGVIDHGTHTREWTRLGGLRRTMPITTILVIIGAASMAGLPLTFGFVAKELFLHAALHLQTENALLAYGLPAAAVLASFFTFAYCLRLSVSPFFGEPRDKSIEPHEGGIGLLFSPALLILLCLVGGLLVPLLEAPLAAMVNTTYFGSESHFNFAWFHGFDTLFVVALAIFSLGTVVFFTGQKLMRTYRASGSPEPFAGTYSRLFDQWIPTFAKKLTEGIMSPSLSRNVMVTLGAVFGIIGLFIVKSGARGHFHYEPNHVQVLLFAVLLLSFACVWIVLQHPVLLFRVIAMTPIGLAVAVFFVLFKAPDLALTQLLVEVAVLIVLLVLLRRLPQRVEPSKSRYKFPRAIIAITAGLALGTLSFVAYSSPYRSRALYSEDYPTVREYYLANTKYPAENVTADYPGAPELRSGGGYNTVNVILVDFRGFDTMGEIMVLGIAGMGIFILLTFNRQTRRRVTREIAKAREELRHLQDDVDMEGPDPEPVIRKPMWPSPSFVLVEMGRIIPAMILVFGIVLFWVGHNQPGGGFIAGLATSVAFLVLYLAFRPDQLGHAHSFIFLNLIPWGMILAIGTGIGAMFFGAPFLTSWFKYYDLGWFGELGLASVMGFDLGVFLVVVGTTMLVFKRFRSE